MKQYRLQNLERERARATKWHHENKPRSAKRQKEYYRANPEVNKAAAKKYREKNQQDPAWRAKKAAWAKANRLKRGEEYKEYCRRYSNERYATNIEFRIACKLRSRLVKKLRATGGKKFMSALDLTGCTTEFLRGYIEALFQPGMTWNNTHIDHIKPLASFDLTDEDEQLRAFHYSNLQPLFAFDNMAKGAK